MIESGSFSGKYDKEEKGVGSKPQLEVLDDSAVLELIVDGEQLFVPPVSSPEDLDEPVVEDVEVKVDVVEGREPSADFVKEMEADRHEVLGKMGLVHSSDFGDEPTRH